MHPVRRPVTCVDEESLTDDETYNNVLSSSLGLFIHHEWHALYHSISKEKRGPTDDELVEAQINTVRRYFEIYIPDVKRDVAPYSMEFKRMHYQKILSDVTNWLTANKEVYLADARTAYKDYTETLMPLVDRYVTESK